MLEGMEEAKEIVRYSEPNPTFGISIVQAGTLDFSYRVVNANGEYLPIVPLDVPGNKHSAFRLNGDASLCLHGLLLDESWSRATDNPIALDDVSHREVGYIFVPSATPLKRVYFVSAEAVSCAGLRKFTGTVAEFEAKATRV